MWEQPVFAYGQAPRMVVHRYRVVSAHVAAVESLTAHHVALELLPAAVTDHQSGERVARRFSRPGMGEQQLPIATARQVWLRSSSYGLPHPASRSGLESLPLSPHVNSSGSAESLPHLKAPDDPWR